MYGPVIEVVVVVSDVARTRIHIWSSGRRYPNAKRYGPHPPPQKALTTVVPFRTWGHHAISHRVALTPFRT